MSKITSYEEYEKEVKKQTDPQRNNALKLAEDTANKKIKQTEEIYNQSINDAKVAYEDDYQKNAVQKMINERIIAEKNANLGLSDSGFNRTQHTANQLSYANQKGNIDLVRQKAINTLESNLADAVAAIKQENESNKLSINQSYDQHNTQLATELYSADAAKSTSAQKSTRYGDDDLNLKSYAGIDSETGRAIFYDENGKKTLYDVGTNPYTGTVNPDIKNGTFDNGYQPNNIEGKKLVVSTDKNGNTKKYKLHGRDVTVWKITGDKGEKEWVWDGINNRYLDLQKIN